MSVPDVHIGDIGTLYRVRVTDEGGDFDPSTATVKQLKFRLAGGTVLDKTAAVEVGAGDEAGQFFLTYTVGAGEGPGSPPDEFHSLEGAIKVQAFLEWADGKQYHSNIRSVDDDGRELRVRVNLQ
jgi:hypothetical protein